MKMPYTEALLNSIPKLEHPSHTRLDAIPGRPPDLVNPPKGCNFAPRCPYVQPKCLEEEPPLVEGEHPGHLYRCWFPVGTPEGDEALARNLAEARQPRCGYRPGRPTPPTTIRRRPDGRQRHRPPPRRGRGRSCGSRTSSSSSPSVAPG